MPRVSDEYLAEKQNQILDAAIRTFASGGFHTTGMAQVIRESGLSSGTVYRYYRSKDELIAAIIDRMMAQLSGRLMQATQNARTVGEVLSGVLADMNDQKNSHKDLRMLPHLWAEALREPAVAARVARSYDTIIGHFAAFVEDLQRRGEFPADLPAGGAAQVMLSVLQGYQLQTLLLGQQLEMGAYLAAAGGLFGGGGQAKARAE